MRAVHNLYIFLPPAEKLTLGYRPKPTCSPRASFRLPEMHFSFVKRSSNHFCIQILSRCISQKKSKPSHNIDYTHETLRHNGGPTNAPWHGVCRCVLAVCEPRVVCTHTKYHPDRVRAYCMMVRVLQASCASIASLFGLCATAPQH